jgi:hypothetical protein
MMEFLLYNTKQSACEMRDRETMTMCNNGTSCKEEVMTLTATRISTLPLLQMGRMLRDDATKKYKNQQSACRRE